MPITGGILALPPEVRALARRTPQPTWVPPMLATLTEERFSDADWIFERKLDGERALTFRRAGRVAMFSRNRLDIGGHYPEVVEWLEAHADALDFVIDGEVVAFDHGQTSFAKLQRRMQLRDPEQARRTGIPVFYYVFDVIHAGGYDLTEIPLRHRKAVLKRLLAYDDPVRLTSYRNREGEPFYEEACRKGWEGLIAKRAGSPYVAGRSRDWLKFKCVNEQEFVIGGFTEPKGSRPALGALLIGYYEDGTLRYAGKVGTGFNERLLRQLRAQLDQLERATPPFVGDGLPRKGVHWVEPELVAEIGFTEWTPYDQLRHPRFLGLREDKPASEVVRERPTKA